MGEDALVVLQMIEEKVVVPFVSPDWCFSHILVQPR